MSKSRGTIVVLFDIDGTLISSGGAGKHAFVETFCADFGVEDPLHQVPFAGRSDRAISLDLMELNGIEPSEQNWQSFHRGYLSRLDKSLELKDGCVLPGVEQLLPQVANLEQVALGLLTGNIALGAQAKLRHYGLAEWFSFGGFGDHHSLRNDIAGAALEAAQAHLKTDASGLAPEIERTIVIGDTEHDITCAHSIGAYAVGVATGSTSAEQLASAGADLVLEDLTHAESLLKEINGAAAA